MAQVLEITSEHNPRRFDSATDKSCETEKVVDVTDEAQGKRLIFLFYRDSKGQLVQMCDPYEGEEIMGSAIDFRVDSLDAQMTVAPRDDTFGSWAKRFNFDKGALRDLIQEHAPS
jgi:hypothetical protein